METYPGQPVQLNTFMGHDAFVTAKAAIEKVAAEQSKITSEAVAKALEGIQVKGITGTIHISPDDHNPIGKEAAIITIEGDQYKFVMKYAADMSN
jgi:branched-chain amino acid transport system substrate-binding protein